MLDIMKIGMVKHNVQQRNMVKSDRQISTMEHAAKTIMA
jgi:hypothetical protein